MRKITIILFAVALLGTLFSCSEDYLEPTLAQEKDVRTSVNVTNDLKGVLNAAYNMMTYYAYYGRDYIIYGEVRSDNSFANGKSGRFVTAAAMTLGNNDGYALETWATIYQVIARANIVINASDIEGDETEIKHFQGQAYAMRALAHFDLLKLYGQQHVTEPGADPTLGVPYITVYKGDDLLPIRNTVADVKDKINSDLDQALTLMSESLNDASRYYITTHAVNALKARVALYFKDWAVAKSACEAVIGSGVFQIVEADAFAGIWKTDSPVNSILELAFSSTDNENINGLQYIYRGTSYGDVETLNDLSDLYEATDVRGFVNGMIGMEGTKIRNMGKYPSIDYSDDIFLIRYEEVILTYAEALFELNNADPNALTELNKIPARRNATLYTEATKDNILLERRKELAFEGFRFDDLARTGSDIPLVDPLKQTHGGPAYGSYKFAFPIPRAELLANSKMVQNFNYSSTK